MSDKKSPQRAPPDGHVKEIVGRLSRTGSRSPSLQTPEEPDPLAFATQPPESETPEEREERLAKEAEAKRISDLIDEEMRMEAERVRKRKAAGEVKLLLLGQAESGKSTLQKQ